VYVTGVLDGLECGTVAVTTTSGNWVVTMTTMTPVFDRLVTWPPVSWSHCASSVFCIWHPSWRHIHRCIRLAATGRWLSLTLLSFMFLFALYYDQELISYRYSSCYCCCCCCWGDLFNKSLRLRLFKSDRVEIRQECSSSKHASIDGVGFLMWCQRLPVPPPKVKQLLAS